MEKFSIFIVEDDLMIAEMLREMLEDLGYAVTGIAKNYAEAIHGLGIHKPGLCFVDINLESDRNGFDVVRKVNSDYKVPFIFLTSYSDKKTVAEAASLGPEAYLLKPFTEADLFSTVEIVRARKRYNSPGEKQVLIKDGTVTVKVPQNDILWLKSDNIYVEVVTATKTFLVRTSLEKYLEELNDESFFRSHRSYAVNIHHVKAVNGQYMLVADEKIPVSRRFRDETIERFKS